jgi:hypothetical protein
MSKQLLIAFLAVLITVSGCATGAQKKPPKPLTLPEDVAVVFGKVVIIENGESKVPYSAWSGAPVPFFYRVESEKAVRPKWKGWGGIVKKDGSFYIRIPRGTYVIYRLEHRYVVIPRVAFQAPYGADAYYVGTLLIDLDIKKGFWGPRVKKINGIEVLDEFEAARDGLLVEYPGLQGEIKKSLMAYDSSMPALAGLQDRHALMGVLNSLGMGLLILGQ